MKEMTEKTRMVRDHKNRDKREEALERDIYRTAQTDAQQIRRLDNRLGGGVGAARERERLLQ